MIMNERRTQVLSWIVRLVAAAILLQTLFFKFAGAPESVYIFSRLGMEPLGRYGSGAVELLASILLLLPRTSVFGALLSLGVMTGAIGSHLTVLGIDVQGDGGALFALALTVTACSTVELFLHRSSLPGLVRWKSRGTETGVSR